jgi:hypothetical protein
MIAAGLAAATVCAGIVAWKNPSTVKRIAHRIVQRFMRLFR